MTAERQPMLAQARQARAQQQWQLAISSYQQYLEQAPADAAAWGEKGEVQLRLGQQQAARHSLQRAHQGQPEQVRWLHGMAMASQAMDDLSSAVDQLQQCLLLQPNHPQLMLALADVHRAQGAWPAALSLYQRLCTEKQDELAGLIGRLSLFDDSMQAKDYQRVEAMLGSQADVGRRQALAFAYANERDHDADYAAAADWVDRANGLKQPAFDAQNLQQQVHHIMAAYADPPPSSAEVPLRKAGPAPVFVVGLPRSGTTLLACCLATDAAVSPLGESDWIPQAWQLAKQWDPQQRDNPHASAAVDSHVRQRIRAHFIPWLKAKAPDACWVIDKLPNNFLRLGWIQRLYPEAVLVHIERDIRDVALSCYFRHLHLHPFSFSMARIAVFIRQYQRMMQHWQRQMGARLISINYETLVSDPERSLAPVWQAMGLPPRRFQPPKKDGSVRTASLWQVRQGLYQHASGRHRHYPELTQRFAEAWQAQEEKNDDDRTANPVAE